jgi:ParB family transcriptional regulator, chromosome partitioning protein
MRKKFDPSTVSATLDELLAGQEPIIQANRERERIRQSTISGFRMIPRERIVVKEQVRTIFPREQLQGLRDNIREFAEQGLGLEGTGIEEPLRVAPLGETKDGENFLLIKGERRFQATEPDSRANGWGDSWIGVENLPCRVAAVKSADVKLLQLIENIQRQDLNPLDEGRAFSDIMRERNLSQNDLVKLSGKSRGYITNRLALLGYSQPVQEMVVSRETTLKHAPLIDAVKDERFQRALIKAVVEDEISVAEVRRRIEERQPKPSIPARNIPASNIPDAPNIPPDIPHENGLKIASIAQSRGLGVDEPEMPPEPTTGPMAGISAAQMFMGAEPATAAPPAEQGSAEQPHTEDVSMEQPASEQLSEQPQTTGRLIEDAHDLIEQGVERLAKFHPAANNRDYHRYRLEFHRKLFRRHAQELQRIEVEIKNLELEAEQSE